MTDHVLVQRRLMVAGRVQGVFFRESCRREAQRLGVAGWVRNLPDGRVEAVAEGSEGAVDALVRWARTGPELARVDSVDVTESTPEDMSGFRIR